MKKKKIYDGRTKKVYSTDSDDQLLMEFKDDIVAAPKAKNKTIKGKGAIDNQVTCYLLKYLESYHVPTHFIKEVSEKEMLVQRLDMIPIEVVVRNIAAGTLVKKFNIEEGKELECPIIEYYLKDEERTSSMINLDHIVAFGHASTEEIANIQRLASKVNAVLKDFFRRRSFKLVDVTLEFGRLKGKLTLGDEVTLNTCHLWDLITGQKYNQNALKKDIKLAAEKYKEALQRILKIE